MSDSLKFILIFGAIIIIGLMNKVIMENRISPPSETSFFSEVGCFFVGELPGTSRSLEFWRCRDDVSGTCFLLMYPLDGVAPTPTPCN